jgi:hypothetical protein
MQMRHMEIKRAKIEIVPLIDVVFFLLATFVMVSLSMTRNQGMQVPLPSASTASKMDECGFPTTSCETIGSSVYSRMPRSAPSEAVRIAWFTDATVAGRDTVRTTSTRDPFETGTRTESPSIFPWSDGRTSPIAFAAPVEVGIMDSAAERARRRSLWGASWMRWSLV